MRDRVPFPNNAPRSDFNNTKHGNYNNYNNDNNHNHKQVKEIPKAKPLPDKYIDQAEQIMKVNYKLITTSKIRNILSIVNDIYNVENLSHNTELTEDSKSKILELQVRMIYEIGRDNKGVGRFIESTNLVEYLKDIGNSRVKFINYAKYLEALVAYHRFFGGRD